MENNVNRGSVTIELSIVLPGIIIIVCLLIMIWLRTFQYDVGILKTHQGALMGDETRPVHIENRWYVAFDMDYDYSPPEIEMTSLQRIVEYVLYLVSNYYERITIHE